jgi:hypothetical protein
MPKKWGGKSVFKSIYLEEKKCGSPNRPNLCVCVYFIAMDPSSHAHLLALLDTDRPISVWAAAVPDKALASLCLTLCRTTPHSRAGRIAALQRYQAIPARYSSQ